MSDTSHRAAQLERVAFFSDAVFAIAITLLVIDIKVPHLEHPSEAAALHALLAHGLQVVGFVVSFLVVAAYWVAHHQLFGLLQAEDRRLIWRNLVLLLLVSFMPFPTAFFSEYPAYQTSLVLYAGALAAVGIAQQEMWRYAGRHPELQRDPQHRAPFVIGRHRSWAVPSVALLAIALSFVSLPAARISLTLIPLAVALLERLARRRARQH